MRRNMLLALAILLIAASAFAKDIDGVLDQQGNRFSLSARDEDRLIVVAFLRVECPLAGVYGNRLNALHAAYANRGVGFVAVNSNDHDSYASMCEFAETLDFAFLKDVGNRVADEFAATHSPQVFLLDSAREVIYSGRIDDQYAPGVHTRSAPSRRDLEEAILEALDNRPITVPTTEAVGCRIERAKRPAAAAVTYSNTIAAILDAHCVECHRPGQAAPFSLLSYADAAAWTDTMRDVLASKRMPPWGAAPSADGVHFSNDRSLSDGERDLIFAWLDAGAPEGDPSERPVAPSFKSGWITDPDVVLATPTAFHVPKEGILEYQEFTIDPGFATDTWVKAIEIRPSNPAVVHHTFVFLQPKNAEPGTHYVNEHQDYCLGNSVPGKPATIFADGTAKLIPAGWNLCLLVHYVTIGKEQLDRPQIGLTRTSEPDIYLATRLVLQEGFVLQPGEVKCVTQELKLDEDALLTAMYPHMHLRGHSMLFEARYPTGATKTLLNVPDYDFEWQDRYVLAQPMILPAGTVLRCTAVYDNSANNQRNPDPTATVTTGTLTTDEMFNGFFDLGYARAKPAPTLGILYVGVFVCCLFCISRRFRGRLR